MPREIPEDYKISDEELDAVWGNSNFGNEPKRSVVVDTLGKLAGGYSTGSRSIAICQELGLLGKPTGRNYLPNLTAKGKKVLYHWRKFYFSETTCFECGREINSSKSFGGHKPSCNQKVPF